MTKGELLTFVDRAIDEAMRVEKATRRSPNRPRASSMMAGALLVRLRGEARRAEDPEIDWNRIWYDEEKRTTPPIRARRKKK